MGHVMHLLPKPKGKCHLGHNDFICTLVSGHSDWLPVASYYRKTTQPIGLPLELGFIHERCGQKRENLVDYIGVLPV